MNMTNPPELDDITVSGFKSIASVEKPTPKMQAWIDARKRHHLSRAQVQMARELGLNMATA